MKKLIALITITAMFIGFMPIIAVDNREPVHSFYMYMDENGENITVDLGLSYQNFSIADEVKEEFISAKEDFYNPNSNNPIDVLHLTDYKLTKNSFDTSEKNLLSLWLLWNVLNNSSSKTDVSFYYKPPTNMTLNDALKEVVYPTFAYIYSRVQFTGGYQQQSNGSYYFTITYDLDSLGYDTSKTNLRKDELAYAANYVKNHPVPYYGFMTAEDEKAYVKAVHDYICSKTQYAWASTNVPSTAGIHQLAYGAYYEGSGVCNSYANAVGIICAYAGINLPYINGDSHAWNMIYPMDGSTFRLIDATWNDDNFPPDLYFWIARDQTKNGSYTLEKHYPDSAIENFIIFLNSTDISKLSAVSGTTTKVEIPSIKDRMTITILNAAIEASLNGIDNLDYDINGDGKFNIIDIALMRRILIKKTNS